MGPENLITEFANNVNIDASVGNFGYVPYGKSIHGRIIYDPQNEDGCKKTFGSEEQLNLPEELQND